MSDSSSDSDYDQQCSCCEEPLIDGGSCIGCDVPLHYDCATICHFCEELFCDECEENSSLFKRKCTSCKAFLYTCEECISYKSLECPECLCFFCDRRECRKEKLNCPKTESCKMVQNEDRNSLIYEKNGDKIIEISTGVFPTICKKCGNKCRSPTIHPILINIYPCCCNCYNTHRSQKNERKFCFLTTPYNMGLQKNIGWNEELVPCAMCLKNK